MSEEINNNQETASKAVEAGMAKVDECTKKVDTIVEKILGIVADHPWEDWLKTANKMIDRYLPAVIAVAGILATVVGFVTAIKYDLPFSAVVGNLFILVVAVFSMHLAPKALALPRSFVDKKEAETLRPELLYILKVGLGLGGFVGAVVALLGFSVEGLVLAVVLLVIAALFAIVFSCPSLIGIKAGYPANTAEESITLMLLPVKIVLVLLTPIVALASVAALLIGICKIFSNGLEAAMTLTASAVLPLALPLIVYFSYLLLVFWLEMCRVFVSMPRKIDELKESLSK